ncbi:MAG: phytanoyl-CoA dioxygenase family protein, partial [Pseudomonadales bacterium]
PMGSPLRQAFDAERGAAGQERVAVEGKELNLPAGSVLFWAGGLLHGAGANRSQDWRYGVILTYSLGWVRQEENQYLAVPAARLAQLSPEVRRLAGFDMYRALGFFDPSVSSAS